MKNNLQLIKFFRYESITIFNPSLNRIFIGILAHGRLRFKTRFVALVRGGALLSGFLCPGEKLDSSNFPYYYCPISYYFFPCCPSFPYNQAWMGAYFNGTYFSGYLL